MTPSTLTLTLNPVVDTTSDVAHNTPLPSSALSFALFPSSSTTLHIDLDDDAFKKSPVAPRRQWTGTPIRAFAPLPRRALHVRVVTAAALMGTSPNVIVADTDAAAAAATAPRGLVGPFPFPCVSAATRHALACAADLEAEAEDEDSVVVANLDSDDDDLDLDLDPTQTRPKDRYTVHCDHAAPPTVASSRYCAYESITAAEGLSAWSFEELRFECYAQSRIARGTNPPPVDQPALAIPPAFAPRIVHQH